MLLAWIVPGAGQPLPAGGRNDGEAPAVECPHQGAQGAQPGQGGQLRGHPHQSQVGDGDEGGCDDRSTMMCLFRYVLTAAHCLCSTKASARTWEGWCNSTAWRIPLGPRQAPA